jgi:hypothetical protein
MLHTTTQKIRAAIWAVIFLGFNPWVFEFTNSNCAAMEKLAIQSARHSKDYNGTPGLLRLSNGAFASAMAAKQSSLPVGLTCAFGYWNGQLNK